MHAFRPRLSRLRLAPIAAGIVATALFVSLLLVHVDQEQERHEASVRAALIGEASGLRAELERAIEARTALLDGMRGFAIAEITDEDLSEEGFRVFAEQLEADTDVPLRSIQLAPQAVVTHVHPLEGNEAAIGHDLLADEARRDAVLETIEARAAVVAGPLELLQGGRAIIIRSPIFVERDGVEEWWGLATVVADFDPLVEEAGLDQTSAETAVAVRFVEGRRNDFGQAVYGDQAVFEDRPITLDVTLPTGRWELAVAPADGWGAVVWPRRTEILIGGLLVALCLGALVGRVVGSQQRYRRATAELQQLIETAGVPIVQVSLDGRITSWNGAATELTGLDESQVVGERIGGDRFVVGLEAAAAERLTAVIDEVIRTGERALGIEVQVETEHGRRMLVVNVSPTRDAGGRAVGVLAVAQDISSQLEAEEIRAENHAIVRAARLKDEFLAGMSHELRTPLNGILGLSSILAKRTFGELNDKQSEYVGHIQQSGRHLLELINDVLDLARIEADEGEIERAPVDLAEVVESAVAAVQPEVEANDLRLVVDLPADLPRVEGDRRRLRQILDNLLSNAVKFTDAGGRVGIDVAVENRDVVIGVWDTGIGIPAARQHLLFHPFQQIDSALNRSYGGTGLGLSLTRRLVDLHGGRIEVESAAGEGSRFTLRLPVGRAVITLPPAPSDADGDDAIAVVLADDHDLNRRLLTDFLTSQGVVVHTAADGVEVVELTRRLRPDVVLMDIQMPRRDGLEATRILKSEEGTRDVPVVALTALAMDGDADRCLAAGCDAYVSKPIDPGEILALVEELVRPVVGA